MLFHDLRRFQLSAGEGRNKMNDLSLSHTLTRYHLQQQVKCSTHEKGNVLDLLLTSSADNLVSSVCVKPAGMSDHSLMSCKPSIHRENMRRETFDYRNSKSIDMVPFKYGLRNSRLCGRDVMSSTSATDCTHIFSE